MSFQTKNKIRNESLNARESRLMDSCILYQNRLVLSSPFCSLSPPSLEPE
jgi:hypothetical protein